ncbi:hypothetical protein Aduo_019065 [Ancylostoma duodenale]
MEFSDSQVATREQEFEELKKQLEAKERELEQLQTAQRIQSSNPPASGRNDIPEWARVAAHIERVDTAQLGEICREDASGSRSV